MANVNLKTDFKDGEFLYADQLKNNFEAIQAALAAMNAIVWQDNADKVVTFRGTTEELMNREIIDGQILYDTTTGESYIDYKGKRISTGSGNAIHIGDTEPTNASTQLWINEDELAGVGSEVVNSLEGNEERMAPSVAAVNRKFERKMITARLSGDLVTNSPGGFQKVKIPLNTIGSNTDKITLSEDGGIKIGAGVSLILINANFRSRYDWQSSEQQIYITKNGLSEVKGYAGTGKSTGGATSLCISPILLSCGENDVFYLSYDTNSEETNKVIESGFSTYVTVEIIEYTKTTDAVEESEE